MRNFFKDIFFNPRTTGAIFPSSKYLAQKMARCVDAEKSGFILELGPGTGAITKAMLKRGISENKIIALELAPYFARQLQQQFPAICIVEGDAMQLSTLLDNKKSIHTVISSLPLRSLSKQNREIIFSEIQKVLEPNGLFIQFTYSMKNDVDFYPNNFKLIHSFIVWRNIPPARVTVFHINNIRVSH